MKFCAVEYWISDLYRFARGPVIAALLLLGSGWQARAQATKIRLSAISPGTASVQLVPNGDFQLQGPPSPTNTHPSPVGWTRLADMFADAGTNTVAWNQGVVAAASVAGGAPVCQYRRNVLLEPATEYVLSACIWNLGDAANHVTAVLDMSDVTGEPQITLGYNETGADQGYFVYRGFNTGTTGTNLTVRLFYDSRVGTGTAAKYYPFSAQWDNVAITKASQFVAPQASGNLRPFVTLNTPVDEAILTWNTAPAILEVSAGASDPDGSVLKVEFFAEGFKIGEATNSPYVIQWSGFSSGTYRLTALAVDNEGATKLSAPVTVSLTVPGPPPVLVPALNIRPLNGQIALSWPASLPGLTLHSATNLAASGWEVITNEPSLSDTEFTLALPVTDYTRYFRLAYELDATTLEGKSLMGYQGWFACPNDGSAMNRWVHWFRSQTPAATNLTVDFWPDISECDPDELFATTMTLPDGNLAKVFSSANPKTVVRHFQWMRDNHLDGVFLQRFTSELGNSKNFAWRNQVASHVRAGAEKYGRVFAIMFDISGHDPATIVTSLTNDWSYLVKAMAITNSPRYLQHRGKPVVAIWGFGFTSRSNTPDDALAVVNFFKSAGCTVMGGVPTYWRTLTSDSRTNAAWAEAYRSFDIISPWAVGRFSSLSGADAFRNNVIIPDLAECRDLGIDYMPVVFPGFSWHNLYPTSPLNQIPRQGGQFYWRQVYNVVASGCDMFYGAMFDELDEGTAMFKMAPTSDQLPVEATLVPLNIDGFNLPSDWYLRLADQAGQMLRGQIPLQSQIPITP